MSAALKTGAVLAAALVCTGVAAAPARAQEATGEITGTVWIDRDGDGQVNRVGEGPRYATERLRSYTEVEVVARETGQRWTAQTNPYGEFHFSGLPQGVFDVSADAVGMRSLGPVTRQVELSATAPAAAPLMFPQLGNNIVVNAVVDSNGDGILTDERGELDQTFYVRGRDVEGKPSYGDTVTLGPANVIEGLPAGVYTVYSHTPPAGTRLTKPNVRTNADPVDQDSDFVQSYYGPTTLPHVFTGDDGVWTPGFGVTEGQGETNPVLTNAASGWCLDQEHPTGTATEVVGAHHCNSGANQRWVFEWAGPDVVKLANERTGHCVDQEHPNAVVAHPCGGGNEEFWRVVHDERVDEAATLVNVATGHCLDQEYPRGGATTKVGAYPCNGGANQKWLVS